MERARLAQRVVELKRDLPALALFLALTLGMTNPLALHLANAVEDKQDALLNTWIIAWVGHALASDPPNLFNANIFSPYPNTLAFSETLLPQGLFALPFNRAFDNTILGYNLVLLASFLLAAYAMYLFVFDLTRSRGAGIIAGTIFAFNPYNLGNLAQVQLLSFGWLPIALMYWRKVLTADRRPLTANADFGFQISDFGFRSLFLFALFFSLQCLSSFYYAFLAGFAVVLYLVWIMFSRWSAKRNRLTTQLPNHPTTQPPVATYQLPSLIISFGLIVLLLTPFFLPYLQVQRELGFERKIAESEPFSASLKQYAEVSPQNILYGDFLAPRPPILLGGYPLDNLFPGFIALALALLGITAKRRDKWFYFCLWASAFLLSLGPRLYHTSTQPTDLALPYRWLYDAIPFLRALRAPVRFDALVMFALAALAGVACAEWRARVLRITNYELRITHLILPLIALEYLAFPAAHITPIPTGDVIPAYTRWLARQPRTTILELPMLASDPSKPLDLTTQYLSTYHWHATPDGYSGFVPAQRGEIAYEMKTFPGERAVSLLQALEVEYVVVHADSFADWTTRREAIERSADLRLVEQMGKDFVYRVTPRAQDAAALAARLYLPNPAAPNSTYTAYLIVQNRSARSFALKPTDGLSIEWRLGEVGGQTSATFALVTSTASVVPVRLTAPPRAGDYELQLRVTSAAIGAWRVSGNLQVRDGEPARQVVIPARVALNAPLNAQYAPGETVAVSLMWMPLNKIDAYYSASVRVVNGRGEKIIAQDREPIVSTFLWTPSVPVPDRFALTLPRDLVAGEYAVQLLMYQADQGVDMLVLDEDFAPRESITFGRFVVR